jgi:urocanate hydratase
VCGGAEAGISECLTEWLNLSHNLDPTRYKQVKKIYGDTGEAARSPFSYLNICDLLRLAVKDGTIRTEESVIKSMKVVRDAAAHADENFVSRYDEVRRLADVKRACLRIFAGKS